MPATPPPGSWQKMLAEYFRRPHPAVKEAAFDAYASLADA